MIPRGSVRPAVVAPRFCLVDAGDVSGEDGEDSGESEDDDESDASEADDVDDDDDGGPGVAEVEGVEVEGAEVEGVGMNLSSLAIRFSMSSNCNRKKERKNTTISCKLLPRFPEYCNNIVTVHITNFIHYIKHYGSCLLLPFYSYKHFER